MWCKVKFIHLKIKIEFQKPQVTEHILLEFGSLSMCEIVNTPKMAALEYLVRDNRIKFIKSAFLTFVPEKLL